MPNDKTTNEREKALFIYILTEKEKKKKKKNVFDKKTENGGRASSTLMELPKEKKNH